MTIDIRCVLWICPRASGTSLISLIYPSTPRAFEPTYNVPANIHIEHPQLRDLIICPERGQIAYATNGGLATRSVTNKHEVRARL